MGSKGRKIINLFAAILIFILTGSLHEVAFGQKVNKVLISGFGGQHDVDVQRSFEIGYSSYNGSSFPGVITRIYDPGISQSLTYARDNGYQIVVRSTTGLAGIIPQAAGYPDIQVVMPAGSNSYVYVFDGDIAACPVIVTGAGDTYNETGYKVEFYAPDPITIEPDYSSFSNGFIAGELSYLANTLNKSVQEARVFARKSIPGDNGPDFYNGYGQINVQTVISSVLPVELKDFSASVNKNNVILTWKTFTEVNNYGFDVERQVSSKQYAVGNQLQGQWEKIGFVNGNGNSNSVKEYKFEDINPAAGNSRYRLKQVDIDGKYIYSDVANVLVAREASFTLQQNYPNPFNPSTAISYVLPADGFISLKVFDVLGKEISTLASGQQSAGRYEVNFDASQYASGIYYYVLQAGEYRSTKQMILLK